MALFKRKEGTNPVMGFRAQLQRNAEIDLLKTNGPAMTVTFKVPGLSQSQLDQLVRCIDEDGFIPVYVREVKRG